MREFQNLGLQKKGSLTKNRSRYVCMHASMSVYWSVSLSLIQSFIHSCIHSGYFYSASSSPLLLSSAPDTARILCRSFTPKRHRQLRVKDLPKVPTWRLEWDSNLRLKVIDSTNAPPRPTMINSNVDIPQRAAIHFDHDALMHHA